MIYNATLVLLLIAGYFRDILKLGQIGHGDSVSLEKVIYDSKLNVQKVCRKFRAIPRQSPHPVWPFTINFFVCFLALEAYTGNGGPVSWILQYS